MNIVITGSSSGIGRLLAEHRLSRGDQVWGLARTSQADLEATHRGNFRASCCDVAQWSQVERVARAVAAAWPHVDGLIACAGMHGEIGRALQSDPLNWSATVRVNLDGTFYAIRAFSAQLAHASRRAKIVCFSGGGATKSRPHFSAYSVAKTGVVRLVETIADEERGSLDINTIAPGAINTRLTDEVLALGPSIVGEAEYEAALKQKSNGGAPAAKVLGLIDWLLSPASDGISGRLLAAPWDPWPTLDRHRTAIATTDVYQLRRIVPEDRGLSFGP